MLGTAKVMFCKVFGQLGQLQEGDAGQVGQVGAEGQAGISAWAGQDKSLENSTVPFQTK